MSQPDLLAQLQERRPVAPEELRAHVRQLAASAPAPRRPLIRRRSLVVALAVLGLALLAAALVPRGGEKDAARESAGGEFSLGAEATQDASTKKAMRAAAPSTPNAAAGMAGDVPPPSSTNAQRYVATLSLRLRDASAVSEATNEALRITSALGGHPNRVNVDAERKDAEAYLVLKVPRSRVQEAVQKLGALGTIVGANVSIQDLQARIDTKARTIDRLQAKLAELGAQPQTEDVAAQAESMTQRIQNLQRQRAATMRSAHFATVKLHMETPKPAAAAEEDEGSGPLHGLGVAFRWIGIVAVYVLALGTPLLLLIALGWLVARGLRRRREEALLAA